MHFSARSCLVAASVTLAVPLAFLPSCDDAQESGDAVGIDTRAQPDLPSSRDLLLDGVDIDSGRDIDAIGPDPTDCTQVGAASAFALDPMGAVTQIHPAVAFDGSGIWVAYNKPDGQGEGGFDVFVTRVLCDSSIDIAPLGVHAPSQENEVDPDIAWHESGVYVAWARDQSFVNPVADNLDIVYAVLESDASVRAAATLLETTRSGGAVAGNAWQVKVAAHTDGSGATLAGLRADAVNPGFLVFAQRLSTSGAFEGEAIDGSVNDMAFDDAPAVYVDAAGNTLLSWVRTLGVDGDEVPVQVEISAGQSMPSAAPEMIFPSQTGSGGTSVVRVGERTLWAFGNEAGGVMVGDGDVMVEVGNSNFFEFSPGLVAAGDDQAAVLYYRQRQGFAADIVVQRVDLENGQLAVDPEIFVTVPGTTPAGPYGPAIAHVHDGVFFVAFAEGNSPDFYLKGRFINLTP